MPLLPSQPKPFTHSTTTPLILQTMVPSLAPPLFRDVGVTGAELDRLIARQRDYFQTRGQGVEWKLRAHDLPADLPKRLVAADFVPGEPSTVLVGFAEEVAAEPVLPDGVVLRRVSEADDLRRIADHQTEVWGFDCSWIAADLIAQVSADPGKITILVAEAGDRIACTAWAVYYHGADFVALLGGTTLPDWRTRPLSRHDRRPGPRGRRPRLPAAARRRVPKQRAHPAPVRLPRDHHLDALPVDAAELTDSNRRSWRARHAMRSLAEDVAVFVEPWVGGPHPSPGGRSQVTRQDTEGRDRHVVVARCSRLTPAHRQRLP